jgi:hypothetical protein
MATWRRKALEYLPHLRRDIVDPDVYVYLLFGMLVGEVWKAHDDGNEEILERIYGYASWTVNHRSQAI